MKIAVVSFKELAESPTMCMSPLRYLGKCHLCEFFNVNAKCKPVISEEVKKLLEEKANLLKRLREINELLREL